MSRVVRMTLALALALSLAAFRPPPHPATRAVAAAAAAAPCGRSPAAPSRWDSVLWIWFENQSYNQIIGSRDAPYLNTIARRCGLATNYYGITHPSLPNYIAATSGATHGITSDCLPASCRVPGPSLFSQVAAARRAWRGYAESMPGRCVPDGTTLYAPRHNPPVYYPALGANCARNDLPLGSGGAGALAQDIASGRLPAFGFVAPNLCHDMHDCKVKAGDTWLSGVLPRILAGPDYRAGRTAVVITFDEGGGQGGLGVIGGQPCKHDPAGSCHVATIIVAPSVRPGTRSGSTYTHYSLLRTTEEMLGLGRLGAAAGAPSMAGPFRL